MAERTIDEELAKIAAADTCTGCGSCCVVDPGLAMALDDRGYLRPSRVRPAAPDASSTRVEEFRATCPALVVTSPERRSPAAVQHPTLGPHLRVWAAWASDPEIRSTGSSGGVLTALNRWLLESGRVPLVVAGTADPEEPRRTVSITLTRPADALSTAGSRYAPLAMAAEPAAHDQGNAVVGKPCEIAALRARAAVRGTEAPLLFSFFCAGTPSQQATDEVLGAVGVAPGQRLRALWYRGRGWPGRFTAVTADDDERSTSYDESWGRHLGPSIQWRCKLCPDGVGESADLAACDWWEVDDRGYPVFTEGDGRSGLVARTARGLEIVEQAIAEGVIQAEPIDADGLVRVQPFQRRRRQELAARMLGTRLAGREVPRYRGFGLWHWMVRSPRRTMQAAKGTWHRVRSSGKRPLDDH